MPNPLVSIIVPSRDRPAGLLRFIVSALATTQGHAVEIVPVLDAPDTESRGLLDSLSQLAGLRTVIMPDDYVHGHAMQKFQAGYEAALGDWIVSGTDDVTLRAGWLDAMLAHPNQGYIGFYDSLWEGRLATLIMVSRKYIETTMHGRYGLTWYHVHGADAEWQARAKAIGAFTICPGAGFDNHRSDKTPDKLRKFGQQFHKKDGDTFAQRQRAGFPEDWPEA